jgi:hypothetical protein
MEEITTQFEDRNLEDRLYQVEDLIVKVKTLHDDEHSKTGQEVYRLTGSVCDRTGKAITDSSGRQHVYALGHTCTLQPHATLSDLITALQPSTEIVISETVQAYRNHSSRQSGLGIGSMSEFRKRTRT